MFAQKPSVFRFVRVLAPFFLLNIKTCSSPVCSRKIGFVPKLATFS